MIVGTDRHFGVCPLEFELVGQKHWSGPGLHFLSVVLFGASLSSLLTFTTGHRLRGEFSQSNNTHG